MAILFVFLAMAAMAVFLKLARRVPLVTGETFGVSVLFKVWFVLWGGVTTFVSTMVILEEFNWRVFWVGTLFTAFVYLCVFYIFRMSLVLRDNGFIFRHLISYKEFSYSEFKSIHQEKFTFVLKRKSGGQITIPSYLREASSVYSHIYAAIEAQKGSMINH
jgi:hypothetical protein